MPVTLEVVLMWVPGQFSSVSLDYMLCSICLSEMIHSRVQNRVIFGVCGLPWIIIISSRNEKKVNSTMFLL